MDTSFIAFFFDENGALDRSLYGHEFETAFLGALSAVDPEAHTWSRLLRGDLIASALAEKTVAVSSKPKSSGHTVKMDMELFTTIVWDFADAITTQWHTLDRQTFPTALGRHGIYCLALPNLPNTARTPIDRALIKTPGYLGALEIDRGNPIQVKLMELLCRDAVIKHGKILLELNSEGDADAWIGGTSTFMQGELHIPPYTLDGHAPASPAPVAVSPRGRTSLERYEGKRRFTVEERVINALSKLQRSNQVFDFDASKNNSLLEANMPPAKFLKYLLDPNHAHGGPKALFFRDTLGITAKDWRYLASQFYQGLKTHDLGGLRIKSWEGGLGVMFSCDIPVLGLNGRTAMVKTAWNMLPGALPHLSTAYPERETPLATGNNPHIVRSDLNGAEKWTALHALAQEAGRQAANTCVPTPMKLVGSPEIYMEGRIGTAWVCVPDARRGFARWLLRAPHAHYERGKGAVVSALTATMSHDRALAYAKAYATVLALNGIEALAESRLD